MIISRVLHPLGIKSEMKGPNPLRAIGATTTFLVALALCVVVIGQGARSLGF